MKISTSTKIGLGIGFVGAITISILVIFTIFRSTSSTAAIGFVFIPIDFVIAFAVFFIWGYSLGYIKTWLANTTRTFNLKAILAFLVSICFAVLLFGGLGKGLLLTSTVSQIQEMNTDQELQNVFDNSHFNRNKFVLGAIAKNPTTSAELLDRIAKLSDPSLHEPMGSLFPIMGNNTKGLAVVRLVVGNPNVSANTIEYLANTSLIDDVLGDIARNPKTSTETLRQLEAKNNYLIDWGLAQNQKTPPDIFAKLLEREKYFTQRTTLEMLAGNPSAPPEIRTRASGLLKEY